MHAPVPVHSVLDMFSAGIKCTEDAFGDDKYFLLNCLQVETMIRNLKDAIWEKDAPHKVTSLLWVENI